MTNDLLCCLFGRSVILSFCRSVVLSFCRSVVLSFYRSVILLFCRSVVLSFCHSVILSFCHSVILSFCRSVVLQQTSELVVGTTCGGLPGDAWSNNQLSFVFRVSSKIDTDPGRRGIVTNGIACLWLLMPLEGSCW